ncbi:unnamed protein product [Acanthoscelides obtectus]|uniref:Uncharacterized protein n=1 Tax=Acanthoscelides obtectus TaxID=200917 RepID=A0A9P0LYJ0_ACAOB|nr:unnamed protein product [Acanthoscelides obtectus]CAK1624024.1 hypothetical protein AOBTE_LOCUS2290 [Acanthoscelides obtectus]
MRSGAGADDVYIPTLWYYDLLLFTSDQEMPTASISNMDADELEAGCDNAAGEHAENNECQILQEHNNESESQDTELQENTDTGVKKNVLTQNSHASQSKPPLSTPKSTNVTTRQKVKSNFNKQNAEFMQFCRNQLQMTNNVISEYDAVGISWSEKLKRMDSTQAILAEALVNKVMTQGLLKKLTCTTTLSDTEQTRNTSISSCSRYTVLSNSSGQQWQFTSPSDQDCNQQRQVLSPSEQESDQQWQVTSPPVTEQAIETSSTNIVDFYNTAADNIDG